MKISHVITTDKLASELFPIPKDACPVNLLSIKMTSVKSLNISQRGIDNIRAFEGFRSKAYLDSVGIATIGYGTIKHDGVRVKLGDTCTKEQAEYWLMEFINHEVEPYIDSLVTVNISQLMFDALCSFIYNLGSTAFSNSSLLTLINRKEFMLAAEQFPRWNKGRVKGVIISIDGLTKRRKAEREIFISGIS